MKGFNADVMTVYHDLPITSFSGWDRVWQIEAVLGEHDRGLFRDSAILCDAMMRDDRIAAVSDTRVSALIASPVQCKPANAKGKAARVAKEIGGDGEFPGLWSTMFPASVLGELSWWGNWLGFGVAQILWDTSGSGNVPSTAWQALAPGSSSPYAQRRTVYPDAYKAKAGARWVPHLKVWHPQYMYWDWSLSRLVAQCLEGAVVIPNPDEQLHGDGKWFVWAPRGYQYGWLKAMVRRIAHKYVMRGWNYRDWARYNERHGLPIIGAITPQNANDAVKTRFKNDIANMGADAVVPLPQGDKPENKFDLKIVEPVARTFGSFQLFKKELDDDIAITFLGQNLTTDNKGGGSRALGEVQNQVRIDKRIEDAHLAVALRNQVLWWDAGFNYDDPDLAPIAEFQVEPPEDESKEAGTLLALGQAIGALNTAEPHLLDVRAIFDRFGLPMMSEEEIAAAKDLAKQEAVDNAQNMAKIAGPPKPGEKAPPGKPAPKQLSAVPAAIAKRYDFQGLEIAVENPAGSERQWTQRNPDGTEQLGSTRMRYDYGFIADATGNDKEELDCYVGPDETARFVYVIHQHDPAGKYDEDKTMLGFASADAAKEAFLAHRNDGELAFGSMSVIPLDDFKRKLRRREGTGKIRAAATSDAIIALIQRMSEGRLVKASRTEAGKKRAARYPDSLEKNGAKLAANLLSRDVSVIVEQINAATSFEDLRERVIKTYRTKLRPDVLAALVKRVNLMAQMAGRYTAVSHVAKGTGR